MLAPPTNVCSLTWSITYHRRYTRNIGDMIVRAAEGKLEHLPREGESLGGDGLWAIWGFSEMGKAEMLTH